MITITDSSDMELKFEPAFANFAACAWLCVEQGGIERMIAWSLGFCMQAGIA